MRESPDRLREFLARADARAERLAQSAVNSPGDPRLARAAEAVHGHQEFLRERLRAAEERHPPSHAGAGALSPLTGRPVPSVEEVAAAERRNRDRVAQLRSELLADAMTTGEVASMLGVSRATVLRRMRGNKLLGVADGARFRFPKWQFDADKPEGVLQGLALVLKSLRAPMSDLGRAAWFVTPKPLLQGRTPVDALREGDVYSVIAEARDAGPS